MNGTQLECWRCAHPLGDEPMPLSRTAACRNCAADLHVCRMCRFFDTSAPNSCREPIAERVLDKERANFCGYLEPRPGAYAGDSEIADARSSLEALENLFRKPDGK